METDARPWLPEKLSMKELRAAAPDCRGCELWEPATQVVFSAGPVGASLMLVGEQPGDREDKEGQPFVGPAGRILEQALEDAGTRRDAVYLTNAVKHFRFEERGKRRIHQKPDLSHMEDAGRQVLITTHPSAVVRLRGQDGFDEAYREFVDDLAVAVQAAP